MRKFSGLDDSRNKSESEDESTDRVSEEEGLKSAESLFKAESLNNEEESNLDESKEFLKYLRFRKKAKDLGLEDSTSTSFYYQGGVHFKDSNVRNHGNIVGEDQVFNQKIDAEEVSDDFQSVVPEQTAIESIETVFDRCEDIQKRSFMISLAVLNGCNYRLVLEASQLLQTILQPHAEADAEA